MTSTPVPAPTPLRKNRDFMVLWAGHAISALGTSIAMIAYPLLALLATGSARTAGIIAFVGMAAGAVLQLPAGVFVDRLPRRALLVTCDAIRAVATASVALAVVADRLSMAHLVVAAVINAACDAFFGPAQMVAVRQVVPTTQLPNAMAQNEARGHLATLGGPPLGGLLFGVAAALPIAVQAASFLTSGLLIGSIKRRLYGEEGRQANPRPLRKDLLTGIQLVWGSAFLRVTLLCAAGYQFIFPAVILVVIASTSARGAPAVEIGAAFSLAGIGGILGAWLSPQIQRRLPPPVLVCLFGATATFALGALMFAYNPFVIGALLALTYFTSAPANGMLAAVQISITPPEMQGRVLSAVMLVASLAAPLGPLAGGWLLQDFGARATFVVLTCISAAITALVLISPAIRHMRLPVDRRTA
ncbi:MFS transporter [Actinopolymorpha pittospori]|uniref:MFS transporter n=1 Tax=Actinopolymorpha pittospori TaxID=648752 RepID=UPI0023520E3E|nr:MFS transporter [Actinopolymorpha pittospori]